MTWTQDNQRCVMSFDYGDKRIGVAIKESGSGQPRPLTTVDGALDVMTQIKHLIKTHQPQLLVVGLPRGLDGQLTAQSEKATAFAHQLHSKLGLEVKMQDETLTSVEAEHRLPKKTDLKTRKALLDQIAAQIILEDYLYGN